jgi:hypothetical protein
MFLRVWISIITLRTWHIFILVDDCLFIINDWNLWLNHLIHEVLKFLETVIVWLLLHTHLKLIFVRTYICRVIIYRINYILSLHHNLVIEWSKNRVLDRFNCLELFIKWFAANRSEWLSSQFTFVLN